MARTVHPRKRGWSAAASAIALALGAGLGTATDAQALVTPDTVAPADAVDTENSRPYWVGLGIRGEAGNTGGTCSGLLINPRTVLFAAHCVDGLDPDAYDGNAPGNRAQVGYTTDPTFGRTNLREWLFGQDFVVPAGDSRVMDASSVMVWYDPRSRFGPLADPNGGTFLPADVAIAAFDTPTELLGRDARDGIGLLFSPVDRLVQVTIGGYGQSGNGMTSFRTAGTTEESFFRRLGTNMLGYLGDERTITAGVYPGAVADILEPAGLNYQDLYWVDFDDPLNRPFDATISANPGTGTVNPGATTNLDFNVFADEATAQESITAAGDSGSPLVTSAYGREVSLGVLSQGSRFFHDVIGFPNDNFVWFPQFSNFGTTAGWNPLFLFWDQIVVNNPYKYVTARAGNREWTDPNTWVQEIDPLYYTLNRHGQLQNRLPTTAALGSSDAAANLGTINPNPAPPAACAFLGTCPATGGGSDPAIVNQAMPGQEIFGDASAVESGGRHGSSPPAPTGPSTALWSDGVLIPVGSGALTGPGTTGFVPNNTNGTPGLQNSTRFFEVNLREGGTLSLTGANVTIDRLNIRGVGSRLNIRSNASLTTTITSYLDAGRITVDGAFNPLAFDVYLGIVEGSGVINAPGGVANYAGVISPGGNNIGTLTINGDFAQSGWGTVLFQIGKHSVDRLVVNGDVTMSGNLLVDSDRRLRFGDRFVVVQGQTISGNFDRTFGSGTLLFGRTVADADSIDLVIDARPLHSLFSGGFWQSLALALDRGRFNGNYEALSGVYDLIDNTPLEYLEFTLPRVAPMNAFQTVPLAVGYQRDFTLGVDARTAELRAGVMGVSQRSVLAGYRIAQAGLDERDQDAAAGLSATRRNPLELGERVGLFISGRGNLSAVGGEMYEGDRFNPSSLTALSSADLTVGADYRVSDGFAIGVATSMSRYISRDEQRGITPLEHSGYGAMVYASMWDGAWFLDSYAGMSRHDYAQQRMPGLNLYSAADAAPGAVQTMFGVRAGWSFEPMQGLTIGPSLALRHSALRLDSYRESGADSFALEIEQRSIVSTTVESAVEFAFQPVSNGRLSPFAAYGRVGLAYELGDGLDRVSARFIAAPDIGFDLARDLDRQWVTAASGFSYRFGENSSLHLEAVSDIGRENMSNTSIQAGFNVRF